MTVFFQSHEIEIRRLRSVGGGKTNFSATFTAYQADIQPIVGSRVNEVNGRIGRTYEAWVDVGVDIKEADQVDSGGKRYSVKSVSIYQGAGLLDHKYLILESQA